MGNGGSSNGRDVEEASGFSAGSGSFSSVGNNEDLMVELMPESPSGILHSPPLSFSPQAPLVPLQKLEEAQQPFDLWMQKDLESDPGVYDVRIPTMITWNGGGKDVCVEGSWDNWRTRKPMDLSGNVFVTMKMLSSGCYRYRFIVDGAYKHSPEMPCVQDDMGGIYNVLNVQEYVPDDLKGMAGFEPPQSPDSSYDNRIYSPEDYSKEPPTVPPQLQATLLNKPTAISNPNLGRPQHVVLNHLYIQKGRGSQPMVALGETCRFLGKYVTVVLYKSL